MGFNRSKSWGLTKFYRVYPILKTQNRLNIESVQNHKFQPQIRVRFQNIAKGNWLLLYQLRKEN